MSCILHNHRHLITLPCMQVEEFCFITENTYTKPDIIQMESDILDKLKFECTTPTVKIFLRRFCRAAEEDVPDDR